MNGDKESIDGIIAFLNQSAACGDVDVVRNKFSNKKLGYFLGGRTTCPLYYLC